MSGASPAATRSRDSRPEGSKSPVDSSEVDLESLSGRGKVGSEDSRLDVECSSSSDTRVGRGRRRAAQGTATPATKEVGEKSSPPTKRKRKNSVGRGRGKGRGRHSSGVGRPGRQQHMEDTDDSETTGAGTRGRGDQELNKLDRLDNAALAELARPRQLPAKYNFYVELGE